MTTACKPIRDCGPEFGRRFERALRTEIRRDAHEATRRFSSRMFEIGRDCDRFERAEAIQAECDRLLALSLPPEPEDIMSLDFSAPGTARHPIVAPHSLTELVPAGAARKADGGEPPRFPGRLLIAASELARDLTALSALAAGLAALVIWGGIFAGRI